MKAYISGKITGLPPSDVKAKFDAADRLLTSMEFEVVNPYKIAMENEREYTWNQYMVNDIALLLECDAILMLDNWEDSNGAKIEHFIAKTVDIAIMYENAVTLERDKIEKISNAIYDVTGMQLKDYAGGRRKRDAVFLRMIFTNYCHKNDINAMKYLKRDRTMSNHYLNKYRDDFKYNPAFRRLVEKIEGRLSQT